MNVLVERIYVYPPEPLRGVQTRGWILGISLSHYPNYTEMKDVRADV